MVVSPNWHTREEVEDYKFRSTVLTSLFEGAGGVVVVVVVVFSSRERSDKAVEATVKELLKGNIINRSEQLSLLFRLTQ